MVAPPLVVRLGDAMFTFPPGKEVIVGRGEAADVRIDVDAKQAISRTHMVLRVQDGQWMAIDKSRNGIYADGIRVQTIPVDDSIPITLGAPTGPRLIFKTVTQIVPAARLAMPTPVRPAQPPSRGPHPSNQPPMPPARPSGPIAQPRPAGPQRQPAPPAPQQFSPPQQGQQTPAARTPQGPPPVHGGPPSGSIPRPAGPPSGPVPRPAGPPAAGPRPAPGWQTPAAPPVSPAPRPARPSPADEADALAKMTGMVKRVLPQRGTPALPPGAITIGRHSTSAIRVDDTLASRTHAYLLPAPTGMQIHDNNSNNGIFVNGMKVPAATLQPGDVVTIGNTDLMFTGATLEPRTAAAATGGLQAHQVGLTIDGYQLLTSVSFAARPGTLTAVIGPSGAGKSTLIKLLAGATQPTSGHVTFDGHDVHAHYASLRSRIGVVPQDDVVHRQLTVDQALDYAAKLRLPADTSKTDRRAVVESVLAELELTQHRAKRVEKLSGGQRKRASVAMELLTGPSLLILDEPTSGLDPALDRQVMSMLRNLADAGRTVIVVTHSLTYLSMCDQVLLLAPGGKTAYAGRPDRIEAAMGTTDWADIFAWVSAKPDDAHAVFLHNNPAAAQPAAAAAPAGPLGEPARTSTARQVFTLMGRQVRLILADRGYAVFLALLPLVMGALCLVVPGSNGLGVTKANGPAPSEPAQLLSVLIIAAVFMGTALTIRDLVGERSIFRREQSVGLSAGAYLTAKVVVYSIAAAAQAAIVVAMVVALKGGPARGALAFGNPVADLYAALALTAIVSAIVGLLLSALARSGDWIMPMLVVMIMSAIVFSGGLIPVTGRAGLNQLSFLLPARWGFAASASTIDLMTANALNTVDDPLWRHQLTWWLTDMGVLLALGIAATIAVARLLRLPATDATGGTGGRKTLTIVLVLVLAAGFVAGASYLTRGSHIRDHAAAQGIPNMPTQGPPPPQKPVAPTELTGLLPDAATVSAVMGSTLTVSGPNPVNVLSTYLVDPAKCAGVAAAGTAQAYGPTNPAGVAGLSFNSTDPNVTVTEYVLGYPDADHAASVQSDQINVWHPCARTTANLSADGQPPAPVGIGKVSLPNGRAAADLTMGAKTCRHVLAADSNVLLDVLVCGPNASAHADDLATKITDKIH
ncbi:hypothetical protein B5P44_06505 [Mycobacterium sp. CBMA 213]|nr:ATP-binding cassette domain-containing protein [Mycolicibacterium sp. CBMA 213]MUM04433.1 hypothetical protein [Mycolicibacterium sp. CBMA 213]